VLSINAQHFHNGGATTVQELAFTISSAVEYTVRLLEKGISIESILKHTHFRMAIGSGYFMEIAKLRALRMMWAKAISAFNPEMEAKAKAYIHAMSSLWNKSIYDPYVNMLRTTTETMSAAVGGADVISVLPFDKVYKYENDFSSRIAQNQQILIKEEAHFDKVVDPAGGSYYIENLTASLVKHSWDLFNKVENIGGFAAAVESDFVKNELAISAKNFHEAAAKRKLNILGTNQFPNQLEFMAEEMEIQPKGKAPGVALGRLSEQFESIRLQTEKYFTETTKRPKVLILSFGNLAMRKARAGFISNFFAVAAYEIIEIENVQDVEQAISLIKEHKAEITAFCSSDDEYFDFISELNSKEQIKNINSKFIIAGAPQDSQDKLAEIGINEYINIKTNVLETLATFNKKLLV
jgi:methylmalonyl-CoA mutase